MLERNVIQAALLGDYEESDRLVEELAKRDGSASILRQGATPSACPHIEKRITIERGSDGLYRLLLDGDGGYVRGRPPRSRVARVRIPGCEESRDRSERTAGQIKLTAPARSDRDTNAERAPRRRQQANKTSRANQAGNDDTGSRASRRRLHLKGPSANAGQKTGGGTATGNQLARR